MCIDYRALNAVTETDEYPMHRMDEMLDNMGKHKWFSKTDLKSGFWQIPMSDSSKAYTAFSTPDGHFEFVRMPFGFNVIRVGT